VCEAQLRAVARFCDACGTRIVSGSPQAEYKQVTVLFADVVGSMRIAATVGAERWREVMAALVNRASTVVHRYGGSLRQFTGDGIMAVFGAPLALEDHAFRACLAAVAIQKEAKRLGDEVAHRDGIELLLRIGLNSGQVVAGEMGSATLGYTAIGEQVGMAQRMESVAPAGGVMVSESTARLVANSVLLGQLEMLSIKGSDEPVPTRRLLDVGRTVRVGGWESTLAGAQTNCVRWLTHCNTPPTATGV
jgi:adenylate cyclase